MFTRACEHMVNTVNIFQFHHSSVSVIIDRVQIQYYITNSNSMVMEIYRYFIHIVMYFVLIRIIVMLGLGVTLSVTIAQPTIRFSVTRGARRECRF